MLLWSSITHWPVLVNSPMTCTNEPTVQGVSNQACRKVIALNNFVFSSSTNKTYKGLVIAQSVFRYATHFLRQLIAAVSRIGAFVYPFDEITLNGSIILLTLRELVKSLV